MFLVGRFYRKSSMKNIETVIIIAKDHYKLIKGLEIKLTVNEYRIF